MNDRGANIDIVFRNGLKDFEVLPPPEIWDTIHPAVVRKQRPFILLKSAALITIVLTLSFVAYQWSREISKGQDGEELALYYESFYPINGVELSKPPVITRKENGASDISIGAQSDQQEIPFIEATISAGNFIPLETDGFTMDNSLKSERPRLAALNSSSNNSVQTDNFYEPFLLVEDKVQLTDRWSIAALASPTYYSRFNSVNDELTQQLMSSEQQLISYSGGVSFSYKLNKRFSIQSGLFFSSIGQEVDGISSFGGFQQYNDAKGGHSFEVLTTNGTVYTNNADVFLIANGQVERITTNFTKDVFDPQKVSLQYINDNLHQNFSYLELPIILRYKFLDKTVDFNLIGGVSYNMLVNNSVYTMVDGGRYLVGKTEGLNMVTISSSLGMGMEYSFSENLSLNLEPTFRYYHNPFSKLSSAGIHPYSFGIFSGISYKF